jgi:exonuclease III
MPSLNINSLTAHIDEVRNFTHDTNIDILVINETKLDASVHSNEVNLPGYTRSFEKIAISMVDMVVGYVFMYVVI